MAPEFHPVARCCWCGEAFFRHNGFWLCPTPECQRRQVTNGIGYKNPDDSIHWLYLPLPRQIEFHTSRVPNTLYGGAASCAKSHAIRWDAYMACLGAPNIQALVLRKTYPELEKTHMRSAEREDKLIGASFSKTGRIMRFPNGSLLEFGHCESSGDVTKYLSTEYDWIGFDELTTFEWDSAVEIMSRARSSKSRIGALVRAGTNPGGISGLDVRAFFIDKDVDADRYPDYDPSQWAYVPALYTDNPYTDPRYIERLQSLPEMRKRQLLESDWYCFEGQFFSVWDERLHVRDLGMVSADVEWFRSLDWGYNAPGVCYWWACLPDGRYYVAHEYKFQGTTVADVCDEIKRRTSLLGIEWVRYTAADPATKQHTGQVGESIAETFGLHGVPLTPVANDRINGWQRVTSLLRPSADGVPRLLFSPECQYAIRTIPAAIMSERNPEDVDTDSDDHALDAIRYGAMSRPAPSSPRRVTPPSNTAGAMLNDLLIPTRRVLGSENVRHG